ncbi:hypothetical protein DPMN_105160 [Dreissena polymorpha]|uniref:non-specific serine/threonine protein kinase n=1 Tax=Dreissena polymorpha TaxID=45954 RepID=A0A9D4K377_DREPO|nr:hypothetical protein DPMN_105160 [Dreissena polymorpha]
MDILFNVTVVSIDFDQSTNHVHDIFWDTGQKFDLAIKMMFNYHVNSNADAILREMERETVPALLSSPGEQVTWDTGHKVRKKMLPPHPNIVTMWGLFVDQVPNLPDNVLNYPAALPQRIHAEGIGKNMTLFLVMKKYPTTLKDYLSVVNLTLRERLVLLTQLLEGVAHMGAHGITHRDMKCDNILLDIDTDGTPNLVISDLVAVWQTTRMALCCLTPLIL